MTADQVVLFRMVERAALSGVILLVALVVMVAFWRSVQRLDLREGGAIGVAGSVALSTPVFVLLAIIGYAHVSLSNTIAVTSGAADSAGVPHAEMANAGRPSQSFVGAAGVPLVAAEPADDPAHALFKVQEKVRSLNCLAAGQDLSARVADDLVLVKLGLLAPVWPADWGAYDAFADWAVGLTTEPPNAAARAAFEKAHVAC